MISEVMWTHFLSLFKTGSQAFKIQTTDPSSRVGVVAKNLDVLRQKGCERFKIDPSAVRIVLESDGTSVDTDKFLQQLPSHTVLVFLTDGQTWTGAIGSLREALDKVFDTHQKEALVTQIRDLLCGDNSTETAHIMSQYLEMLDTNIGAEKRSEDEDWFEGLGNRFSSKSEAMKNTAQSRIRSYFTSAKEQIDKEYKGDNKIVLKYVLEQLDEKLKRNSFHGAYFSRKSKSRDKFCDADGWFTCEGAYNVPTCDKYHSINPYASLGYRQLFGLWNLDHVIEKSREVIPSLCKAADHLDDDNEIDADHVYSLLFTRKNLKLVHIGCHKKSARPDKTCVIDDFYT